MEEIDGVQVKFPSFQNSNSFIAHYIVASEGGVTGYIQRMAGRSACVSCHRLAAPQWSGRHVAFVSQYPQAAPASDARRTILAWPAYDAARESELIHGRPAQRRAAISFAHMFSKIVVWSIDESHRSG
jgi:hypothetical protein